MADRPQAFAPDELDRLEDALDRWSEPGYEPGPEDSSLGDAVTTRLHDYRAVLAMTRDALPMEDVPDDLLAGVLAEARRAPTPVREATPAGPSWWERLRRSLLLPGVALAGSAALLLWLVQPGGDAIPTLPSKSDAQSTAETKAARVVPEDVPAPAAPVSPAAVEAAADDLKRVEEAPAANASPPAPSPADPAPAEAKADRSAKSAPLRKKSEASAPVQDLPGLDDAALAEGDKEELRDTLERADRARRDGDCAAAMAAYQQAMAVNGPNAERARAAAGYGLCLQQRGDSANAEKYFTKARKLSPSIDAWIDREGPEGSYSKKPAKPKAKVVDAFDDPPRGN